MRFLWLLLSVALFAGCSEAPPEPVKPIPRVKTFLVGDKALGQLRRISGKLIAADSSVLSFALSGTIATVNVSSGDSVNKSQLLASLEKRPFELAVKNSRAQLNIARAKLNEKQKQYSRFKELFQEQVVSRSELEVAESELGTARGNLQSAQSTLETTTRDLKNTALIAPFSGRLAKRSIEPFQEISVGSEAFVLESAGSLQVEVLVPETLIRNVDHGQVVQVDFPTIKDSQVAGQVVEIGSQVQAGNAFPVKVQLTASNVDLRPGMSAAVLFNFDAYLENRTVYMIPLAAIAIEAGLISNYGKEISSGKRSKVPVYIFDENSSTVKLREIVVGELRGNSLEVFEGLEAGEQVVTAGVVFLRDNMQARRWDASQGLIE